MDVVSVTRRFLKLKVGGANLAARHSRIIKNGQKGGMWVELAAETTPTWREAAAIHLSLK